MATPTQELQAAWTWHGEDGAATDELPPEAFGLVPAESEFMALTADHGEHFSHRRPFLFGKSETFGHGEGNAPLVGDREAGVFSPMLSSRRTARAMSRSARWTSARSSSLCNLMNLQLDDLTTERAALFSEDSLPECEGFRSFCEDSPELEAIGDVESTDRDHRRLSRWPRV